MNNDGSVNSRDARAYRVGASSQLNTEPRTPVRRMTLARNELRVQGLVCNARLTG